MRLVQTVLLLFLTLPVYAQMPDTTSAWRYFPLEVGNVWEYEGFDLFENVPTYGRRTVSGDTLIDGVRHFHYVTERLDASGAPIEPPRVLNVRFDTTATAIETAEEVGFSDLVPGCPLGSDFGVEVECRFIEHDNLPPCYVNFYGGYGIDVEVGGDTVTTSVKTVDTGGCEITSTFAAGLGFVGFVTLNWYFDLRYARVGGVEYGEPFPVATEGAPESATAALTVFPNPARDAVTVRLSLDRSQRVLLAVYNVLGRRVLARDLGAQPVGEAVHRLDVASLPAGVYVVRFNGDAGARATARVVRH